jgi:hypothetical protein
MARELKAIQPLISLLVKASFLLALLFGCIGVVLVYLGSTGTTEISIFGQSIKSQNVGISSLFLSVVMIVLLVKRILGTVNIVAGLESKSYDSEIPKELLEKHQGNKVAAIQEITKSKNA